VVSIKEEKKVKERYLTIDHRRGVQTRREGKRISRKKVRGDEG